MRIVAAAGGASIQGLETEAEAIVGDITAGGTFFLIVGGTMAGGFGGLIYVAARSWLPGQMRLRAPLYGLFMTFVAAVFLLDKHNPDFLKLGHPVLSVTLFAVIPFLYGVIQVPVAGWLERKLPPVRPSVTPAMLYTLASLILLAPVLLIFGIAASPKDGPLALLLLVPVALVYALIFLRANGALFGPPVCRSGPSYRTVWRVRGAGCGCGPWGIRLF
jgi:hypothetical protein